MPRDPILWREQKGEPFNRAALGEDAECECNFNPIDVPVCIDEVVIQEHRCDKCGRIENVLIGENHAEEGA